jgi:hypothetical protein
LQPILTAGKEAILVLNFPSADGSPNLAEIAKGPAGIYYPYVQYLKQ